MNKLKKIFVGILLFSTVFVLSCTSVFALTSWSAPSSFKIYNNATGVIGVLKTSMLDSEAKKFMIDYYNSEGGNYIVAENGGITYFILLTGSINSSTVRVFPSNPNMIELRCAYKIVMFSSSTGEPYKSPSDLSYVNTFSAITGSNAGRQLSCFIQYKTITNLGIPKSSLYSIWKPVFDSPQGAFFITYDDIGNKPDPPPESSEPEPPVSSEPPPPPYMPTIPEIGKIEDKYIPYDTTIWNYFLKYVMNAIGKSANYGFLILAIILAFWLITRIVRIFSRH